ncbi:MAG: FKBP-type peptidyl-prolyl cis-trans isomerase [Pirellulaceae bacterium]|nr:FKBP-type peptidyl-prolyl cis-trans isomerase [Pirellulaceae bacterium]
MRRLVALLLSCLLASSGLGQEKVNIQLQEAGPKPGDVAAYKIGFDVGTQIHGNGLQPGDIVAADFLTGFVDALKDSPSRFEDADIEKALQALSKKVQARIESKNKDNLVKATAFLEENKKQQGVVALPSGLQYQVIKPGTGATPKPDSTVKVHYEGKLVDGKVFDSSIANGQPVSFPVNQVIPGWTEALTRMKVGDKWKLFIPPNLAYGERSPTPLIPPNSALVFEVELLEVVK